MSADPMQDPVAAAQRCYHAGELAQAKALCEAIAIQQPDHPVALGLLALIAYRTGDNETTATLNRRAIAAHPNVPAFHANLAAALNALGRSEEAIAAAAAALALAPDFAPALINLGNAHTALRRFDPAADAYRRALAADPASLEAQNNLANVLRQQGRVDDAIALLHSAIAAHGDVVELYATLGNAFKDVGRIEDAVAEFRKAQQLAPRNARIGSGLLYKLWFDPRFSAAQIVDEHIAWAGTFADPLLDRAHFNNPPAPERRLRVAYLSPELRANVIGVYLEPLLRHHDHQRFEIFCYSTTGNPDEITARLQRHADHWRPVHGMGDAPLAQLIRGDEIDILVELTNHLANHRLLVMARRPAPVQLSYLAHPAPTGLSAIDHVLTDPFLDPPATHEHAHADRLLRLPRTYLIYPADGDAPAVGPPPVASRGFVTFISVNNFAKINAGVLDAWAKIMRATPGARLLMRIDGGAPGNPSLLGRLAAHGLDPARVELLPALPRRDYLDLFARADIALDPFPYAGYTTSLDALWMGVPLITLAGRTSVGRAGVSILRNLCLPELIAGSADDYVRCAVDLAGDVPRLTSLRASLRGRMQGSALMNAPQLARDIESLYRIAWRRWCDGA